MTMQHGEAAARVTDPAALSERELLARVLDRLDAMEARLSRLDAVAAEAPKAIAVAVDSFDEMARQLGASGVDLDKLLENALAAATRLGTLLESKEFVALMHSGVLDPETLAVVGRAGDALTRARKEPAGETGLFGLLGAMGDRDVRTALDFLVRVARHFGKATQANGTSLRLGTGGR